MRWYLEQIFGEIEEIERDDAASKEHGGYRRAYGPKDTRNAPAI